MTHSDLHVVILAAGRGERFATEGVTVPKPLIEFRGRSLMYHSTQVALALRKGAGSVIVVTTPAVAPTVLGPMYGTRHVVEVSATQPGPVASALLSLAHLPWDAPVVFMDCDNYFPPTARSWVNEVPVGQNFLLVANKPNGSAAEDFLNVGLRSDGSVQLFAEKKALEGCVKFGAGVYGFSTAALFRHHAWRVMAGASKEPPMSEVTAAVAFGANCGVSAVIADGWLPIGTPAQLMVAKNVK